MRIWSTFAFALAAVSVLAAADFWIAKPADKWSEPEIKRMVTDSPWAKQAAVRLRGGALTVLQSPEGPKTANPLELPAPAPQEILVRWDSALPIREACGKGGMEPHLFSCVSKLLFLSGLGKKFDELQKDFYVIGLSNYPKMFRDDNPEHSDAANAVLARLSQRIQESTFLKRKGQPAAKPAHVVTLPAGQTLIVVVFFPRTEALSITDNEVVLEAADGAIELKATFNLKKMLYRGSLEL